MIKTKPVAAASEEAATVLSGPVKRIFIVQRHLDTILHYDFRISLNGALKSWAMPSGPSMNPDDRRLAIATADKPMSYASGRKSHLADGVFEMWDKGLLMPHSVYSSGCTDDDVECQLREGRLRFTLKGKKLKGVFSLIRINGDQSKNWLLIKGNDKFAVSFNYNTDHFINPTSIINRIIRHRVIADGSRDGL